jgi:RimJ/RimL family protein N-acetyltransferase
MVFESERLYLRELTSNDAESFYRLNSDTEVLKYTGDSSFKDVQEAKRFLENYNPYIKYGYGRWAVIRKIDSEFIGWCGLKYHPEIDEVDLGFRLFKKFWNQGYATEAAKSSIDYAFNYLKINQLIGRVELENKASIQVLKKIGFELLREFDFEGKPGLWFVKYLG